MTSEDNIATARAIIANTVRRTFVNPPAVIAHTFSWVLDTAHTNARFLHLPWLTYQATRPNITLSDAEDSDRVAAVTAAWHLLHCAARLFDDIEDGEKQSFAPAEPAQVINAATALIFIAQLALTSLHESALEPRRILDMMIVFNTAIARMIGGQANDLALNVSTRHTPEDVLRIAGAKSGEFFALACRVGAILSTTGSNEIAACTAFGYNLGVLLQISDDFHAVWAPQRRSDLTTLRCTLPMGYALAGADSTTRSRLETWLAKVPDNSEALTELQSTLAELGALHYITLQSGLYYTRAHEALLALPRPSQAQHELLELLDAVFPAVAMDEWSSLPLSNASTVDPNSGSMA